MGKSYRRLHLITWTTIRSNLDYIWSFLQRGVPANCFPIITWAIFHSSELICLLQTILFAHWQTSWPGTPLQLTFKLHRRAATEQDPERCVYPNTPLRRQPIAFCSSLRHPYMFCVILPRLGICDPAQYAKSHTVSATAPTKVAITV